MWLYTCYMLYTFLKKKINMEKGIKIRFNDFADFVFGKVWGEQGLVFHDSDEDLEKDLKYLSRLGIVKYHEDEKTIELDEDKMRMLEQIAKDLEHDPLIDKMPLLREYLERIKRAAEAL